MAKKDIVVIGASAGGMAALQQIARALPPLEASLFVVWHMPPGLRESALPRLLEQSGPLPARHPADRERIEPGRIYVAPADHHLLVERGYMRLTRGPKENRFRPAVDPLFRSAAYAYGPRVIGVVLTGALDDGTAGLWTVKLRGGTTIVQSPEEAMHPSMPLSALQQVEVDHTLSLAGIGALLGRLTAEEAPAAAELEPFEQGKTRAEIEIAEEENALERTMSYGDPSPFTCPECHGVLARMREDPLMRFRCHTGHAYSAGTLLDALGAQVEERLFDALRSVDENVMLLSHLGEHLAAAGKAREAEKYFALARAAQARAQPLRELAQQPVPDMA